MNKHISNIQNAKGLIDFYKGELHSLYAILADNENELLLSRYGVRIGDYVIINELKHKVIEIDHWKDYNTKPTLTFFDGNNYIFTDEWEAL